ncbi:hypothetical protein A0257_18675 [Hymenobacter psoromatis]|nr:hypothetical protein A0257_18675 [Hymenobacter psoromatis]
MHRNLYLKISLCFLVLNLLGQVANAQETSSRKATTPLDWMRQVRSTLPPTASFKYLFAFYDDTNALIKDSLIVLTDTRRIRYIRIDKITKAAIGMTKTVYWPSLNDADEGKELLVNGKYIPVGFWTLWYDRTPRDENKKKIVAYDAQGQPIPGSLKQWKENKPGCDYVLDTALPSVTDKLTCQFCTGSSRAVVPVDLPEDALGIVFKIDIRDESQGSVTFKSVAGMALAFSGGGPIAALTSAASSWGNANSPPTSSTKCVYFLTTDEAAAQRWFQSKGLAVPASQTMLHAPLGNPTSESRPIMLTVPLRRFYVCVQNNNNQAAATSTVSVMAMRQPCQ